MRRYWSIGLTMMVTFLVVFAVVEVLDVPLLHDPSAVMGRGGLWAASVGVGLLIADVLIPVPSSLVMVANGALFGLALGAGLSLLGSVGAASFGFALGRRGGPLLNRLVSANERHRANAMLERWGVVAIIVTRPVPILAETVAILAGTSALSWGRLCVASLLGSLPAAVSMAAAGATGTSLDSSLLIFALVVLLAGGAWLWGRRLEAVVEGPARASGSANKTLSQ